MLQTTTLHTTPTPRNDDERVLDVTVRPQTLDTYIGQEKAKANVRLMINAARERGDTLDHILFYGPPGLGKTTLAHIIARERGVAIKITSGPALERVGDLGAILTNLSPGDVLFIDEIHRLNKTIEEVLYPAMEDGKLDIIIGKGPSARTLQLDLPGFTLIGATTRLGAISNPLRNRFGVVERLTFYDENELSEIITRAAQIYDIAISDDGAHAIARRARQTPRVANRLLRRVRDFAQMERQSTIDADIAHRALTIFDIDEKGLEPADRHILDVMITKFRGGPVGVQTIASATAEETQTIEDVYEPYLMRLGFIARTPRGRIVTERGFAHLGITPPPNSAFSQLMR